MHWLYSGQAPVLVQTKAEISTACLWASFKVLPAKIPATKAPEKASPAPTVSATVTLGVSMREISLGD